MTMRWGCLCSRVDLFTGKSQPTKYVQSQKYQCNLQGMMNEGTKDSLHLPFMVFQILGI